MVSFDFIKNFFDSSISIQAMIIYPNKKLLIKKVNVKEENFKLDNKSFLIDEKAIYFYKRKPILIYHYENTSPLIISKDKIKGSVGSGEIESIIGNNIVHDLLSGQQENDMLFYAVVASAILSLITVLIQFNIIKVGG